MLFCKEWRRRRRGRRERRILGLGREGGRKRERREGERSKRRERYDLRRRGVKDSCVRMEILSCEEEEAEDWRKASTFRFRGGEGERTGGSSAQERATEVGSS